MTGSLAILRWVGRLVRVERRQHALVVSMIAFGIAIATLLVTTAVRMGEPSARFDFDAPASVELAVVGDSTHTSPPTSPELMGAVRGLLADHPDTEVLAHSHDRNRGVVVAGADPTATLTSVNFSLLNGRWPDTGEVAMTTRAFDLLELLLGEPVEIGDVVELDGKTRLVVGSWENPNDLAARTAVVPPSDLDWTGATILLPAPDHRALDDYLALGGSDNDVRFEDGSDTAIVSYETSSTLNDGEGGRAILGYLGGTILCLQIAVLASAGFTVLAQRRTRQLGMLSAMGATPRRLGLVMQFTGFICGLVGGAIGFALGVGLSIASTPLLQLAVNHRLGFLDLPWALLLPAVPLAVVTAMAAAWWPARRVRRTSSVDAIAARRPPQTGVAPGVGLGLVLMAIGTWMLVHGAPLNSPTWIVGGTVALVVGALLLVPGVVSILGAVAEMTPMSVRIAWRDVNRNRSRSAAAVGAATIALAVPFGLASFVASLSDSWVPYLPENVVSVTANTDDLGTVALDEGPDVFAPLMALVPDAELIALQQPVDRVATDQIIAEHGAEATDAAEFVVPYTITLARGSNFASSVVAYGTPELLEAVGVEDHHDDTDLLVFVESKLDLPDGNLNVERRDAVGEVYPEVIILGDIDEISRDDVQIYGWLLVNDEPYSTEELDQIEARARRDHFFSVGMPDSDPPFLAIRAIALITAGLLGMSVVAVAVALIRVESEAETRALNALGAPPRLSRAIGAATAAGLVLVAVAVAVPSSFLTLLGVYLNPDEHFEFSIPWLELGVVVVVLPALAAAGGWLFTTVDARRITT